MKRSLYGKGSLFSFVALLANQWLNWQCCLYWSTRLTTLTSHKLFSQNTDLPVVLCSETMPWFRKGWMLISVTSAETTLLTSRKLGCMFFAFILFQHECRSNLCYVPFWCFFIWSISDLLFGVDHFKPDAKSNTLSACCLEKNVSYSVERLEVFWWNKTCFLMLSAEAAHSSSLLLAHF